MQIQNRKRLFRYTLVAFSVIELSACSPRDFQKAEQYSKLHSDSGITGKSYDEIIADFNAIANTSNGFMEVLTYGKSLEGRALTAARIRDPHVTVTSGKRPGILISEGIHGNEYLNIADRLPSEFLKNTNADSPFRKFLAKGGVLYVVPILNPDGYTARQRENKRGQDLNRNFTIRAAGNAGFTEPETQGISELMNKESQTLGFRLEASMEYHCCIGGLIHPWAYTAQPLAPEVLRRHTEVGQKVKEIFNYPFGTVREIVGYDAVGGSDDYYLETFGQRAFSFEGSEGIEQSRLASHVQLWDFFFALATTSSDANVGSGGGTVPPVGTPTASDIFAAVLSVPAQPDAINLLASTAATGDVQFCLSSNIQDCQSGAASVQMIPAVAVTQINGRSIYKSNVAIKPTVDTSFTVMFKSGQTITKQFLLKKK